jgi:hypothetical protein
MPKMKHASGGRSIEVRADQVQMYASQGWEQQPAKSSAQTTTKAPAAENKE